MDITDRFFISLLFFFIAIVVLLGGLSAHDHHNKIQADIEQIRAHCCVVESVAE